MQKTINHVGNFIVIAHDVNYEVALEDQKVEHDFLRSIGQEKYIRDNLKQVKPNLIGDHIFEIRGLTNITFYTIEDAKKVIEFINKQNYKKIFRKDGIMTVKVHRDVSDFVDNNNIEFLNYLTYNHLINHSKREWIKKVG